MFLTVLVMVHPDMFLKVVVNDINNVNEDVKSEELKNDIKMIIVAVDVWQIFKFINDQIFSARQHMLEWVQIEASKLRFGVVIRSSHNDTSRRQAFVTMTCERSGKYFSKIRNLKHEDARSRKCECPFKLYGYCRVDDLWRFNVICGLHNH